MSFRQTLPKLAWFLAFAWVFKTIEAARGLPRVPELDLSRHDLTPPGAPSVTVIIPACNEAGAIRSCIDSLLAQDYPNIHLVAIDDRSTDATGAILDTLATQHPGNLEVLHIAHLPCGWLGKTHALALGARHAIEHSRPDFLLFTDADILFRPDAIRRSLASAIATAADHHVTFPTTLIHRWDEAAFLSYIQTFGLWAARPWRVADPRARRDAIGIGAFNLIRSSAYQRIGGFEALRLAVIEDVALARRVKQTGLRQRVAFGRCLVNVHWAAGAAGLIRVMTKNIFAAFNFRPALLLLACSGLSLVCVAPFAGLFYAPTRLPATIVALCTSWSYRLMSRRNGLSAWNALFAPLAATAFIYTLLRSMAVTLHQGGIRWRNTFYPLEELRKHTYPTARLTQWEPKSNEL